MKEPEKSSRTRRHYPAMYEKLIPIALMIIAGATLVAIAFAGAVALGLLP